MTCNNVTMGTEPDHQTGQAVFRTMTLMDIPWAVRFRLHLLVGVAILFLAVYGRVVCPFIDTLSLHQILTVLGGVGVVQIVAREWLCRWFPARFLAGKGVARQGFIVAVVAWLGAGVVASVVHALLYPGFHWSSHLKLLSGYWGLGAGILAQLEYVMLERSIRGWAGTVPTLESVTARLMESFMLFTLVPAMMMILMSFRFVFEGFTDRGAALEVLFLGGCFVLAGLCVAWLYGRALRQDCDQLLCAVASVAKGDFQVAVDTSRPDELGQVALGINEMAQGLVLRERIRDAFGRFVNPEVAASFIQAHVEGEGAVKLGGQRRHVAILMADIRNFTALSERNAPEQLIALLNDYFSGMVAAIQAHGGMVDKFIGDAIMAVFGLAEGRDHYPEDALTAALAMRTRLAAFNRRRAIAGLPTVENGIGIHLGEVVAGYIGSADRLEYTVIGHSVNLAARIEGQTKPPNPPILFSAALAERVGDRYPVKKVGTIQLNGITGETDLFTVASGGEG